MATYSEDFGTLTSGQDVTVLSGWSEPSWSDPGAEGFDWSATTGTGTEGDAYVSISPTQDGPYTRLWDPTGADISGPVEILIKHRVSGANGGDIMTVAPFLMGNSADAACYGVFYDDSGQDRWEEYEFSSAFTLTGFVHASSGVVLATSTWLWIRFQIDGSNNHRFKVWEDGSSEPGTWTVGPTADSAITTGRVGFFCNRRNVTYDVDFISLGTAGDSAPSPGGVASVTITDASDEQFNDGESVTITGTWSATEGASGAVILSPTDNVDDAGAVEQTITDWTDATTIVVTMSRGSFNPGTDLYMFVKDADGNSNASGYVVRFNFESILSDSCTVVDGSPING